MGRQCNHAPVILIVDDNPDDRERYIRLLRKISAPAYRILEAEGAENISACIAEKKPDCVLLDYSLPGLNGLDILRQLVPQYPFLPIIMMTGQGNESVAVQSMKQGAQHYLVKSEATPESLHQHIEAAMKQRALECERSELMQRLVDSNTELERFAYVASHDLQEPIRMINNFSKILLSDYRDILDAQGQDYLLMLSDSGERMRDVVNDLLDYSRFGNEATKLHAFDGNLVLESALENLKTLIDEQDAVIKAEPMPQLYGCPVQIMRLLQNLITNAIKYQPADHTPRVYITTEELAEHWRIHVRDNGFGIDARFIDQIFEPFRRLHTWDTIKGSGLGLAICKKIAAANGGRLEAASIVGEGSVFTLTLPKPQPMQEAA